MSNGYRVVRSDDETDIQNDNLDQQHEILIDNLHENFVEGVPEDILDDATELIHEVAPEDIHDDTPGVIDEDIPEDINEVIPDDINEVIPDDINEEILEENIAENIPEDIPEDIAEDIPEDIAENIDEDINELNTEHFPVPEDIGVEGSEESTNLVEIPVPEDDGVEGDQESTDLADACDASVKPYSPNKENCQQFYDCTNKESSSCPNGMWFDPNYIGDTLCQYPQVICAADNNICDCAEKYPPPPPDELMEDFVSCLKDNRFHLFPSQVSCGRYFICHNEMKHRMECRQGLHYNAKTKMCDYPEDANCRVSNIDSNSSDFNLKEVDFTGVSLGLNNVNRNYAQETMTRTSV